MAADHRTGLEHVHVYPGRVHLLDLVAEPGTPELVRPGRQQVLDIARAEVPALAIGPRRHLDAVRLDEREHGLGLVVRVDVDNWRHCWNYLLTGAYSTTGFASRPRFSISTSTRSSGSMRSGGVRAKPTPAGVPVA